MNLTTSSIHSRRPLRRSMARMIDEAREWMAHLGMLAVIPAAPAAFMPDYSALQGFATGYTGGMLGLLFFMGGMASIRYREPIAGSLLIGAGVLLLSVPLALTAAPMASPGVALPGGVLTGVGIARLCVVPVMSPARSLGR